MPPKSYELAQARSLRRLYHRVLSLSSGPLIIYAETAPHIDAITTVLWSESGGESLAGMAPVQVLVNKEAVLKRVTADFKVGVQMSELVQADVATYRVAGEVGADIGDGAIVGTPEAVGIPVVVGGKESWFEATESTADVYDVLESAWNQSDSFQVRVDPWPAVVSHLEELTDTETATFFEEMVGSCQSLHPTRNQIDIGHVVVLVGAWFELEQTTLTTWVTDVGVMSKAAVGRRRSQLEEAGVVEVGKEPGGRGAPAKTLGLGEAVREQVSSPGEFVKWAHTRMSD